MKQLFTPLSLGSLRAFSACLLTLLMLTAPVAPLTATTSHEPSAQTSGDHKRKGDRTPRERLEPYLIVNPLSPAAPNITATLNDAFVDNNASGRADPGSTVTYTAVVSNTGNADATGVQFNETIDPNTTFVAGSLKISPLAFDDAYNVTGSTLNVAAPGVLGNDTINSASVSSYGVNGNEQTTIGNSTPTAQAGSISLNADGSFTYTPANSFTGTDTFKYILANAAGNSTATVTFTVGCPTITVTNRRRQPARRVRRSVKPLRKQAALGRRISRSTAARCQQV